MKIKIKCANCNQDYEYIDEDEESIITGYTQKDCPYCRSNAKRSVHFIEENIKK